MRKPSVFKALVWQFPISRIYKYLWVLSSFHSGTRRPDVELKGGLRWSNGHNFMMPHVVKQMHGLHFEKLNRSLKHWDIVSDDNFIERKIIFDQILSFNKKNPTSIGVEWCQDVVFGKMNSQVNHLFMQLFESLLVDLVKSCF